jgi:hypothetical protein
MSQTMRKSQVRGIVSDTAAAEAQRLGAAPLIGDYVATIRNATVRIIMRIVIATKASAA